MLTVLQSVGGKAQHLAALHGDEEKFALLDCCSIPLAVPRRAPHLDHVAIICLRAESMNRIDMDIGNLIRIRDCGGSNGKE